MIWSATDKTNILDRSYNLKLKEIGEKSAINIVANKLPKPCKMNLKILDKYNQIENQNHALLKKLVGIQQYKSTSILPNIQKKKSLNSSVRMKELLRISRENKERIKASRSISTIGLIPNKPSKTSLVTSHLCRTDKPIASDIKIIDGQKCYIELFEKRDEYIIVIKKAQLNEVKYLTVNKLAVTHPENIIDNISYSNGCYVFRRKISQNYTEMEEDIFNKLGGFI